MDGASAVKRLVEAEQAARALVKEIAATDPEAVKAWSNKAGVVEAKRR